MPRNNFGEIAKSWMFESSSGSGVYETLQYTDGSTLTCNCPGWTRRVDASGNRSCKHTRMVEQGVADLHATSSKTYAPVTGQRGGGSSQGWTTPSGAPPPPPKPRRVEPTPAKPPPSRFKPTKPQEEPPPKRRFGKVEVPVDDDLVDADRFKRL